jgi:hypothetical protein
VTASTSPPDESVVDHRPRWSTPVGRRKARVFVVHPDDYVNLDQMVETLARDGYLVGQEYVTAGSTPAGL